MVWKAWTGQGRSQEPGTLQAFPMCRRPSQLGPYAAAFLGSLTGSSKDVNHRQKLTAPCHTTSPSLSLCQNLDPSRAARTEKAVLHVILLVWSAETVMVKSHRERLVWHHYCLSLLYIYFSHLLFFYSFFIWFNEILLFHFFSQLTFWLYIPLLIF